MSGRDLLTEYQRSTGATQTQLAASFRVTSAYVSMLLAGKRVVTQNEIAQRIEVATAGAVPASSWVRDASKRPVTRKARVVRRARRVRAGRSSKPVSQ
jgi:hypothetical protein